MFAFSPVEQLKQVRRAGAGGKGERLCNRPFRGFAGKEQVGGESYHHHTRACVSHWTVSGEEVYNCTKKDMSSKDIIK